jgi:hypothetical protein
MPISSNSPENNDRASSLSVHDTLSGGGEIGALIRTIDWGMTPVGPMENWPHSLKTAIRIMLDCRLPMYIAWGKEFTQFYNDAYRPILGNKHPQAMGLSAVQTWTEIWSTIGPMWQEVLQGKSFGFDDFKLTIERFGYPEDCYFNFSYSPIPDDAGNAAGILVTFVETTKNVLTDRRQAFQLKMADTLRGLSDPHEIMAKASELLGHYLKASRVLYGEIDLERKAVRFHSSHTDGTVSDLTGLHHIDSFGAGTRADMEQGATVVYDDVALDRRANDRPASMAAFDAMEIRSGIGVPDQRRHIESGAQCPSS